MEIDEDVEMKDTFDEREEDLPQAIPTITTRVNFIATRITTSAERRGSKSSTVTRDVMEKAESVSSAEDPFDEPTPSEGSLTVSPDKVTIPSTLETEDISDGEISSAEEDSLTAPGKTSRHV